MLPDLIVFLLNIFMIYDFNNFFFIKIESKIYTVLYKNNFYLLIKKKACKIQAFSQGSSFRYLG